MRRTFRAIGDVSLAGASLIGVIGCAYSQKDKNGDLDNTANVLNDFSVRYDVVQSRLESGRRDGFIGEEDYRNYQGAMDAVRQTNTPQEEREYLLGTIDNLIDQHYFLPELSRTRDKLREAQEAINRLNEETKRIIVPSLTKDKE